MKAKLFSSIFQALVACKHPQQFRRKKIVTFSATKAMEQALPMKPALEVGSIGLSNWRTETISNNHIFAA